MEITDVNSKYRILLFIAGFVALSLGSFIWFVASWDPTKEDPVVSNPHSAQGDAQV